MSSFVYIKTRPVTRDDKNYKNQIEDIFWGWAEFDTIIDISIQRIRNTLDYLEMIRDKKLIEKESDQNLVSKTWHY